MNADFRLNVIKGSSIDELVREGVKYIQQNNYRIQTTSGPASQANNVVYVLENSYNRVHTLRSPDSVKYLAAELYAYLLGSLKVSDGLARASKFWNKIADKDGKINSNYGYYVFYQKTPSGISQFDWVRENIIMNPETCQAVININDISHKIPTKDFPCTLALIFHLDQDVLNLDVASRSTDVITGLPYDLAFFSFVLELLTKTLECDLNRQIAVGYTAMHACFTQIYDKTSRKAEEILFRNIDFSKQRMPGITDARQTLWDIYHLKCGKPKSDTVKWIINNKE